jgi:protein ImuB
MGMMLTDARALVPGLLIQAMAPEADARALAALADWCGRYSPWVSIDGQDDGQYGICLDVTGCAHLFGGEEAMLADMARRLQGFDIQAQMTIADSLGAAWAIARYGVQNTRNGARYGGEETAIVAAGENHAALEGLPVAALRLSPGAADALARLGLGRIGELYNLPPAALTARFGREVTYRLEQALGRAAEPLSPRPASTSFWSRLAFAEPIGHRDHIARAAGQLVDDLCAMLEREARGARRIELRLYLADGTVQRIGAGLNRASRQPAHLLRLLDEHLPSLEAGFGADLMLLIATQSDPLPAGQRNLKDTGTGAKDDGDEDLAPLLDRLGNRLGSANVARFAPVQSHLPEQAVRLVPPLSREEGAAAQWRHLARRPVYLLPRPELVEAVAEVPDGPPVLFRWRGIAHRVQRGDGPERIAPEWWHDMQVDSAALTGETRDYYRIEDSRGQRFWLYRRGLYDSAAAQMPDWYIHGFFA